MESGNSGCLFCRIIAGEIPVHVVYQDDQTYAFADIRPQAPVHLLVLPRKHIPSLAHTAGDDQALLGHMLQVCAEAAKREGVDRWFPRGKSIRVRMGGKLSITCTFTCSAAALCTGLPVRAFLHTVEW